VEDADAVQRDDPNIVDHFGEYHHVAGNLQNLIIVVVA